MYARRPPVRINYAIYDIYQVTVLIIGPRSARTSAPRMESNSRYHCVSITGTQWANGRTWTSIVLPDAQHIPRTLKHSEPTMAGDLRLAFTSGWPLYAACLARDSLVHSTYAYICMTLDLFLFQSRVYPRLAESEPFKTLDHWQTPLRLSARTSSERSYVQHSKHRLISELPTGIL